MNGTACVGHERTTMEADRSVSWRYTAPGKPQQNNEHLFGSLAAAARSSRRGGSTTSQHGHTGGPMGSPQ